MVFTKDLKIVDCKGFEGLYMHIYIYDFKGLRISKNRFLTTMSKARRAGFLILSKI